MKNRLFLSVLILSIGLVQPASAAPATETAPARTAEDSRGRISALEAAILGVVEGLTEYLPVSSTGHLILASHAMQLTHFSGQHGPLGPKLQKAPAIEAFEIVIQLGAILAVVGLYRKNVAGMCRGLVGKDPAGLRLLVLLIAAFIPSAVVGLALHKPITEYLFSPLAVSLALVVGGVAMIVVEYLCRIRKGGRDKTSRLSDITARQALIIGLVQCLALWPGTSRSMVTIVAGLVVGLDMLTAAEFSFLLALPTLGAATVYEGLKSHDLLLAATGYEGLIIGLAVSWLVAALAIKGLVRWLTRHGLYPFGIYRIILAALVYAYFAGIIKNPFR